MRRGRYLLILLTGLALALTALALFAHPYFAITARSGGRTLVVEGWLHEEGMAEAARLFEQGGYTHVITTGTIRPFAYYLQHGDTLELQADSLITGPVVLSFAGLSGALLEFQSSDGGAVELEAQPNVKEHTVNRSLGRQLRIIARSVNPPPQGEAVIFVAGLRLNGVNAHAPWTKGVIRKADGTHVPLTPTFAHQARQRLIALGLDPARLTAVPTWHVLFSRTLSTAIDVTAYTDAHRVDRFDVATLAVHARRTHRMYSIARSRRPGNGIVALYDPWCARWSWWGNYYGWFQMLKELAALPLPWMAE